MFGDLYLKAQEEKLILERHYRNKGKSIRSMENNMSKDIEVSCTHSSCSWHGYSLTGCLDMPLCLIVCMRVHMAE